MKSLYLALALLLGCALPALSQNVRVDGVVQSAHGPAPNVFIAVCSQPANLSVTPCATRVLLCSSLTDVVCTSSNPVNSDGLGNYFFYIPAGGTYTYQFYGNGLQTRSFVDQQPGSATSTGGVLLNPSGDQTIVGSHQLINRGTEQTGFPFTSFDAAIQAFALNPSGGQVGVSGQTSGSGNVGVQGIQTGGGSGSGVFGLGEGNNSATFGGFFAAFANVTSGNPYVGTAQFGQMNLTVTGSLAQDVGANAGEAKIYGGTVRSLSSYITAGNTENAGGTGGVATNSYGYNVQQAMNIGTPGATVNAAFHANDQGSGAGNYGILLDGVTHNRLGLGLSEIGYIASVKGPYIDVMAPTYGCLGTGSGDDGPCILAAINQGIASGGCVLLPAKHFRVATDIYFSGSPCIHGVTGINGSASTEIDVATADGGVFGTTNPTSFLGGVTITDIRFVGGVNPIDIPFVNDLILTNIQGLDQTGCLINTTNGERWTIHRITGNWSGQNGRATYCFGDPAVSIFHTALAGQCTGGCGPNAGSTFDEISAIGTNGGNHSDYIIYGGDATSAGGQIAGFVNFRALYCHFAAYKSLLVTTAIVGASFDVFSLDNCGDPSTSGVAAIQVTANSGGTGQSANVRDVTISGYDSTWNTNHFLTDFKFDGANGAVTNTTIMNSRFRTGDNATTFGIKTNFWINSSLQNVTGSFFTSQSIRTENVIGSTLTTSNLPAGANTGLQLSDVNNADVFINLCHDVFCNGADTSTFHLWRNTAGGGVGSDDFSSTGSLFTVREGLKAKGINSNTPTAQIAAIELFSGIGTSGLPGGQTTADLAFEYGGSGGGFRHWLRSVHDPTAANNALKFYLNTGGSAATSSAPGTGNTLGLTISPTGTTAPTSSTTDASFGSLQTNGPSACETSFAPTILNTGATTTDTGLNCLPANSVIDAVVYRVTTAITTSANFTIGDATTAARFCGTQSTLTLGATGICFVQADQTGAPGPRQVSAAKVRVTLNANPGAGAIRLIVYYHTWTAPTS